jgi:hypothetical protein
MGFLKVAKQRLKTMELADELRTNLETFKLEQLPIIIMPMTINT